MSTHDGHETSEDPPATGPIVVGVDTSEPSKDALRWAAAQAALTGAELRVVMCWDIPATAYWAPVPDLDLEQPTREALERTVAEVLGPSPAVKVTRIVTQGRAAATLIDQSRGAALLVVGSRGHGELAGMLIGSVSQHCVSQAACPVVVVRRRPAQDRDPAPTGTGDHAGAAREAGRTEGTPNGDAAAHTEAATRTEGTAHTEPVAHTGERA